MVPLLSDSPHAPPPRKLLTFNRIRDQIVKASTSQENLDPVLLKSWLQASLTSLPPLPPLFDSSSSLQSPHAELHTIQEEENGKQSTRELRSHKRRYNLRYHLQTIEHSCADIESKRKKRKMSGNSDQRVRQGYTQRATRSQQPADNVPRGQEEAEDKERKQVGSKEAKQMNLFRSQVGEAGNRHRGSQGLLSLRGQRSLHRISSWRTKSTKKKTKRC